MITENTSNYRSISTELYWYAHDVNEDTSPGTLPAVPRSPEETSRELWEKTSVDVADVARFATSFADVLPYPLYACLRNETDRCP